MRTRADTGAIAKIAAACLAATSAMTLFSFAVADTRRKQLREPRILGKLIKRLAPATPATVAQSAGWMAHYTVGFLFCAAYDLVWQRSRLAPTWLSGSLLGAISGLIGIIGWKTVLQLHPRPPRLDVSRYYPHLLVAHVIFGVVATWPYGKGPDTGRRRAGTRHPAAFSQKRLPEEMKY